MIRPIDMQEDPPWPDAIPAAMRPFLNRLLNLAGAYGCALAGDIVGAQTIRDDIDHEGAEHVVAAAVEWALENDPELPRLLAEVIVSTEGPG